MAGLRFLLYPFSIIYDGVTSLRNYSFDKGWLQSTSFDIPIIAVGNLSTGGTGKTPMIEYLLRQYSDKQVAVLSRGYGRTSKGYREVVETSNVAQVGDEPLQFKLKFKEKVVIAVCEKRLDGIHQLLKDHDLDLILLDDAYQHRYVQASQYILLTSYHQPYYSDFLLPAGNLREARSGADRAQSIVVTKCPDSLDLKEMNAIRNKIGARSHQQVYFSKISYDDKAVGIKSSIALSELEGKSVTVLTGIAKPAYFVEFLKNFTQVKHLKFPDHYAFQDKDVEAFSNHELIITTERITYG